MQILYFSMPIFIQNSLNVLTHVLFQLYSLADATVLAYICMRIRAERSVAAIAAAEAGKTGARIWAIKRYKKRSKWLIKASLNFTLRKIFSLTNSWAITSRTCWIALERILIPILFFIRSCEYAQIKVYLFRFFLFLCYLNIFVRA